MKTLARIRSDLRGIYRIPFAKGWIDLDNWTPCEQPDELDNEQFNVILFDDNGNETYRVSSVDLDFKEATS